MKLREVTSLALSVACASEGADPAMSQGPNSFVGAAGSAGSADGRAATDVGAGGMASGVEPRLTGNIQGNWSYVSARALEVGDGFVLRLYSEPLSKTSDFVPTRNYARLAVPALGDFDAEGAGQSVGGALAEFVVCARPGSPCVGAAVTNVLATGRIRIQRIGAGLLEGSVDLRSGNDFIEGDFDGVESYAAGCTANACRCNGRQLERCSWDTSTWRAASCSELVSCVARDAVAKCCGVVQP
jgi:hypothetical protein